MNGTQLLKKVAEQYPSTVRYILSGHSDRELIMQSVGYAHRYLSKPCDSDELKRNLNGSLGLRKILNSSELHERIAKIKALPSPPKIYHRLVTELQSESTSVKEVADLISTDVALTAKMLQMVNSAFFGLPRRVESPLQAVNLLGLDVVQGLVLTAGVFNQFEGPAVPGLSIERIYNHSVAVGTAASRVAKTLDLDRRVAEDSLMAGLLHDVGKLIQLMHFAEDVTAALRLAKETEMSLPEAERQVMGVSHAELGAHLLSLWGLPDSILEAVALHHDPAKSPSRMIGTLATVHLANVVENRGQPDDSTDNDVMLDKDYLADLDLLDRIPEMLDVCQTQLV
jgi:putative nucleotidyltransferase with HDIG domain